MRIISNSIMAALVIAALFWGNCFSCPQTLLAAQVHHCCHKTKAPAANCQLQNLQQFVKAGSVDQAAPVAAELAAPISPLVFSQLESPHSITVHTPPALISLRV